MPCCHYSSGQLADMLLTFDWFCGMPTSVIKTHVWPPCQTSYTYSCGGMYSAMWLRITIRIMEINIGALSLTFEKQ